MIVRTIVENNCCVKLTSYQEKKLLFKFNPRKFKNMINRKGRVAVAGFHGIFIGLKKYNMQGTDR